MKNFLKIASSYFFIILFFLSCGPKPADYYSQGKYQEAYSHFKAEYQKKPKDKNKYYAGETALTLAERNINNIKSENLTKSMNLQLIDKNIKEVENVLELLSEARDCFKSLDSSYTPSQDYPLISDQWVKTENMKDQTDNLLRDLEKRKAKLKSDIENFISEADKLKQNHKFIKAKEVLQKAQQINPNSDEIKKELQLIKLIISSESLLSNKQYKKSRLNAQKARDIDPNFAYIPKLIAEINKSHSGSLFKKGKEALADKQYSEAFSLLTDSCELDPQNEEKASCLERCKNEWVESLCSKAETYTLKYRFRKAQDKYQKALDISPNSQFANSEYRQFRRSAAMYHKNVANIYSKNELFGNCLVNLLEANHYNENVVRKQNITSIEEKIKRKSRINVALMDFKDPYQEKGQLIRNQVLSDMMHYPFIRDKKVQIMDRRMLKQIFSEQKLSMTGMVDKNKVVKTGKVHGVNVLIFGEVLEFNTDNLVRRINTKYKEYVSGHHKEANPDFKDCLTATTAAALLGGDDIREVCAGLHDPYIIVEDHSKCYYDILKHTRLASISIGIDIINVETTKVIYNDTISEKVEDSDKEIKPTNMDCASKAGITPERPDLEPLGLMERKATQQVQDEISGQLKRALSPKRVWKRQARWFTSNKRWEKAVESWAKLLVLYPNSYDSKEAKDELVKMYTRHPEAYVKDNISL